MNTKKVKIRATAYSGKGYGTLRLHLFENARQHIEKSMENGYYCEAIAIIESVITDRLESRLIYLKPTAIGFRNLGSAISELKGCEEDTVIKAMLCALDNWREKRNSALHELVKIEEGQPMLQWDQRIQSLSSSAGEGYYLLKKLYNRVADLNPRHKDRVFECPTQEEEALFVKLSS